MAEKIDQRIDELARQKLDGKSYSEIRAELLDSGLSETEVSSLIRQVDEKVLKEAVLGSKTDRSNLLYRAGLFLAIGGLLISVVFNLGFVKVNLPELAVYAPFITGILVMFYAKMQQRRQAQTKAKGPGPIRRQRPFK